MKTSNELFNMAYYMLMGFVLLVIFGMYSIPFDVLGWAAIFTLTAGSLLCIRGKQLMTQEQDASDDWDYHNSITL